jgi:asparagine synthase (glutamine-hydrolysing)
MCGIAGIVSNSAPVDLRALQRMDRAVAHRGPDDHGIWSRADGTVALAHRRLSILDLSPAGHQPFISADARFVITYNGEIYNFKALRAELIARGRRFRSESDTEVILAGYAEHGDAFVERLRGMFAFAIWDERERLCIVARDRFGIKPFYYSIVGGQFAFASSVRAIAASRVSGAEPDADAMQLYLRTGSVPEPWTLLRDVKALEAGSIGVWQNGALSTRRYWSIGFAPVPTGWDDAVSRTRAALADSVAHHFVSDVPVGVFLSGGIDSNALVALSAGAGVGRLNTFSIAFPAEAGDEGPLARRSAAHFGTTHQEWALDGQAGLELFERFVAVTDQPSIDGLNTFAVSKLAHDRGLKVVLSGVGGDELFGGYASFARVPSLTRAHRALSALGLNGVAGRIAAVADGAKGRRVGEWLGGPASIARSYEMFRAIFTGDEARRLTAHALGADARPPHRAEVPESGGAGDQISALELSRYMRNQLLRDADVMSMAWGLELRVPFLDSAVFEALRSIPAPLRLRANKRLLTAAVPELPEWIVDRPKRGFLFPIERWIGGPWREVFAQLDRTSPVPLDSWYRKWCVFMLDQWIRAMRSASND